MTLRELYEIVGAISRKAAGPPPVLVICSACHITNSVRFLPRYGESWKAPEKANCVECGHSLLIENTALE